MWIKNNARDVIVKRMQACKFATGAGSGLNGAHPGPDNKKGDSEGSPGHRGR